MERFELDMPRLFIMCGLPASGKSTFAQQFIRDNDIRYVSRDEIRFSMVKENEKYFSREKEVFRKFAGTIAQTLVDGFDVIADATHLNRISRDKLIRAIDQYTTEYTITYIVLETSLETCMERNALREGRARVPDSVMKSMAENWEDITNSEKTYDRYDGTLYLSGV